MTGICGRIGTSCVSTGEEPEPRSASNRAPCLPRGKPGWYSASAAVLKAPALVAGFDDVAVMRQPIQQRGCHFGVAEDARPFGEGEIGRDDDRGALVKPADQMKQQLPAGLSKRQIT